MLTIEGVIENVIFRNDDNGYTVASLATEDGNITVVGETPFIALEERVKLRGSMVYHNTYGEQFSFETMEIVVPTTKEAIESYLASGLLPNIGPKTAKNIVGKFGEEALDIIHYSPGRLLEVPGIGEKKLESIVKAYDDQREIRDIMLFLQKYNISVNFSMKIYKAYGNETIQVLKENPYRLAEDIYGIGFKKADEIAGEMGIGGDNPYRIKAGINYALNQGSMAGHCYLPKEELLVEASKILELDQARLEGLLGDMAMERKLVLVEEEKEVRAYLTRLYEAENNVCRRLLQIGNMDLRAYDFDVDKKISEIEEEEDMEFAKEQKNAIRESIDNGFLVITGGPGTGKTTTINAIIGICEELDLDVVLAAPTGRAAKRMSETSGREASTIHRLLGYLYQEGQGMGFDKDEDSPIDADIIIVDEASMIDVLLMESLLRAISQKTRVVLVGDIDQLPSVGPGNILRDIIDSEIIKVVKLDRIFRQSEESMIIVNAHRINKGDYPLLNLKDKDFYFLREPREDLVLTTILDLIKNRLPSYYGLDRLADIQVLSPMKKGDLGVNSLNENLQKVLNPSRPGLREKKIGSLIYRVGDKVMQMKNNYEIEWTYLDRGNNGLKGKGIFNGDMGIIMDIDEKSKYLEIVFDEDKKVLYEFDQLDDLSLSYAITVHKSQGSEFPVVIMPMTWGPPMLLMRNLLYTAITRAKALVVLVGSEKYLNMMIRNDQIAKRYSGLDLKLRRVHAMAQEMLR